MHLPGEGSDRAGICVGDVMANDAAMGTILLVGDVHGSMGGGI